MPRTRGPSSSPRSPTRRGSGSVRTVISIRGSSAPRRLPSARRRSPRPSDRATSSGCVSVAWRARRRPSVGREPACRCRRDAALAPRRPRRGPGRGRQGQSRRDRARRPSLDAARSAINFTVSAWNLHALAAFESKPKPLAQARADLRRRGAPRALAEVFEALIELRATKYGDDPRIVGDWHLGPDGRGGHAFRCEAPVATR